MVQLADIGAHQFIPVRISQHLHHRGIDLLQGSGRIAKIDAFLKGFKKLGEARLAFALLGDVAGQPAGSHHFPVLYDRLKYAVEITHHSRFLDPRPHRAGPVALFRKPGDGSFQNCATGFVENLIQLMSHQIVIGTLKYLGDALVHGPDFSIQRNSEYQVIEAVDQVAVTLAGRRDHVRELVQLLRGRGRILHLLEALDETPQFVDLPLLLPKIKTEQDDEDADPDGKRFEIELPFLQALLRQHPHAHSENGQHQ